MPTIAVPAGGYSVPFQVYPGTLVSATPGSGGSVRVEYTKSGDAAVKNGTAAWTVWPKGTTSSAQQDVVSEYFWVRFYATTVAGTFSVDQSPGTYPEALVNDWLSARSTGGIEVLYANNAPITFTDTITSPTSLRTVDIPGSKIGANGILRVTCAVTYTNSANSKNFWLYLNGVQVWGNATTSGATNVFQMLVWNANSEGSQRNFPASQIYGTGTATAPTTSSVDTTASCLLDFVAQHGTSGENITSTMMLVELLKMPT